MNNSKRKVLLSIVIFIFSLIMYATVLFSSSEYHVRHSCGDVYHCAYDAAYLQWGWEHCQLWTDEEGIVHCTVWGSFWPCGEVSNI